MDSVLLCLVQKALCLQGKVVGGALFSPHPATQHRGGHSKLKRPGSGTSPEGGEAMVTGAAAAAAVAAAAAAVVAAAAAEPGAAAKKEAPVAGCVAVALTASFEACDMLR